MGTAGQLIVKRYRLVRALGQGTTGNVWEGHDTLLDRPVAVRQVLLPPGLRESRRLDLAQRISREARQAERLRHPHIAAVYDIAEEDGTPYVIMELVRSRSLDGIIAGEGPLPPERAASIARKVLSALAHAHAAGVRHGDVRPANVLIGHDGRVLLADFGTGALAADPAFVRPTPARQPAHGHPVSRGTDAFLAPERAHDPAPTIAADLWSLGATLHMAVTAKPPIAPLAPALDGVPAGLRDVIGGLLRKDPGKRLTAEAAEQALAETAKETPAQPARRRGGRTRLIAAIAAAVVVAGAVGGWALLRPGTSDTASRVPLAATASATPPATPSASPSPTATPTKATSLRLKWHLAEAGWRAGVPRDWTLQQAGDTTWWLAPEGKAHFGIQVTGPAWGTPLTMLRSAEATLQPAAKGYRQLRLKPVTNKYGAASDWEFTWTQRKASAEEHLAAGVRYHQYRRVISTGATTSVLTWTTTAEDWSRLRPTLVKAFRLYKPPPVT